MAQAKAYEYFHNSAALLSISLSFNILSIFQEIIFIIIYVGDVLFPKTLLSLWTVIFPSQTLVFLSNNAELQ